MSQLKAGVVRLASGAILQKANANPITVNWSLHKGIEANGSCVYRHYWKDADVEQKERTFHSSLCGFEDWIHCDVSNQEEVRSVEYGYSLLWRKHRSS
jgi:hypothetical protein